MAEQVVSPGVFTNEIDQSFLPAAVADIGAALIGPTVKGPPLVPTAVSTFSEFEQLFGDVFTSGSSKTTYLTSIAARQYLKNHGSLTVVRILDDGNGAFAQAYADIPTGSGTGVDAVQLGGFTASVSASTTGTDGPYGNDRHSDGTNKSFRLFTRAYGDLMNNYNTFHTGSNVTGSGAILRSGSADNVRWEVTSTNSKKGTFNLMIRAGNDTYKKKQILETWPNLSLDPSTDNYIAKVIGDSKDKIVGTVGEPYIESSGSFPNMSKYVWVSVTQPTNQYIDNNGSVTTEVNPRVPTLHMSSSLPAIGSGSYHGTFISGSVGWSGFDALGNFKGEAGTTQTASFYENISTETQGFYPQSTSTTPSATAGAAGYNAYIKALNILKNQDEYDINLLLMPGILTDVHALVSQKAIDVCEDRGDCFLILDPVAYSTTNITTVTGKAEGYNTSYAAMYWPWIQVAEPKLGKNVWVPPSVVMAGIYAFNDKVAHPWFAPAGLNRGGIDSAVQAARKLTHANRDTLYDSNVNPIATFPGQGVVAWGQKTLQKKSSALDRVNVRRLLIKVKKFIASASRFLVFEQNNVQTRTRFLNIANPFLEQVQSQSGLNAFRVVMDDTNNTPDTVDRNILYGQIFLQPTKTAEFIILDFTVQPTGATFPE